jgi:hypothetical protein
MPELTRRRSTDAPEECWHIYFGDVHVGTIEIRTGIVAARAAQTFQDKFIGSIHG